MEKLNVVENDSICFALCERALWMGYAKKNVDYFFLSAVKIEEQLADGGFCQKRLDIKITDDAVELHGDAASLLAGVRNN